MRCLGLLEVQRHVSALQHELYEVRSLLNSLHCLHRWKASLRPKSHLRRLRCGLLLFDDGSEVLRLPCELSRVLLGFRVHRLRRRLPTDAQHARVPELRSWILPRPPEPKSMHSVQPELPPMQLADRLSRVQQLLFPVCRGQVLRSMPERVFRPRSHLPGLPAALHDLRIPPAALPGVPAGNDCFEHQQHGDALRRRLLFSERILQPVQLPVQDMFWHLYELHFLLPGPLALIEHLCGVRSGELRKLQRTAVLAVQPELPHLPRRR